MAALHPGSGSGNTLFGLLYVMSRVKNVAATGLMRQATLGRGGRPRMLNWVAPPISVPCRWVASRGPSPPTALIGCGI